jgi:hypothetical protein
MRFHFSHQFVGVSVNYPNSEISLSEIVYDAISELIALLAKEIYNILLKLWKMQ